MVNSKISIYYTLVLFLALLGFTSYIFSIVSNTNRLIATITAYLLIISIAMLAKLTGILLVLSLVNSVYRGILFALPFIAIIIIGALTIFLINPEIFKDERYNLSYSLGIICSFYNFAFIYCVT
jgi:hypothetical protein